MTVDGPRGVHRARFVAMFVTSRVTREPSMPRAIAILIVASPLLVAAAPAWSQQTTPCARYGPAEEVGRVAATELDEVSGLAASRRHPGVLWAHNDSGDAPRLFALSAEDASLLATITVAGAQARDWEDLAAGPCGPDVQEEHCLYIGDIGNNAKQRDDLVVYRVPEPALDAASTTPATALPFGYPFADENPDAETLMVSSEDGRIYVVTKRAGAPDILLRFPTPSTPGQRATLEVVARAPAGGASVSTGGDWAPDGASFVVRTYFGATEYHLTGRDPGAAFATKGRRVQLAGEPQGEAIAYGVGGQQVLYTLSEHTGQPLYRYPCLEFTSGGAPADMGAEVDAGPDTVVVEMGAPIPPEEERPVASPPASCRALRTGTAAGGGGRWWWLMTFAAIPAWRRRRPGPPRPPAQP